MSIKDSSDFRAKAAEAAQQARQSSSLSAIRNLRRTEKAYLALAENEDWLAGKIGSATTEPVLGSAAAKGPRGARGPTWSQEQDRMARRSRRRFR